MDPSFDIGGRHLNDKEINVLGGTRKEKKGKGYPLFPISRLHIARHYSALYVV
jgi:hypothetical protein